MTASRPWGGVPGGGERRFVPLLCALVLLFLIYPVMVELGQLRFFRLVFALILLAALWAVSTSRRLFRIALALAVPTLAGQFLVYATESRAVLLVTGSMAFLFLALTTVTILIAVLRPGPVTGDELAGAICAYLLLGLSFAILYSVIAVADPASFHLPAGTDPADFGQGGEYVFIYFSFVTLTTVGYGDIRPAGSITQTLAWMEAAAGPLYLAILIARLVGLHIRHRGEHDR